MCIALIVLLYLIIITIVVTRTASIHRSQHRRQQNPSHSANAVATGAATAHQYTSSRGGGGGGGGARSTASSSVQVNSNAQTSNHHYYHHHHHYQYRATTQKWSNALLYTLFVISILAFEILLTNKLDYEMSSTNLLNPFQYIQQYMQHQQIQFQQQHLQAAQSHNELHPSKLLRSLNSISLNSRLASHLPLSSSLIFPTASINALPTYNSTASISIATTTTQAAQSASSSTTSRPTSSISYFIVSLPLYAAYLSLMCLSFNSHSGNMWWFGMRRDFCELFLVVCPIFELYGNIQIKFSLKQNEDNGFEQQETTTMNNIHSLSRANGNRENSSLINANRIDRQQTRTQASNASAGMTGQQNINSTIEATLNQTSPNGDADILANTTIGNNQSDSLLLHNQSNSADEMEPAVAGESIASSANVSPEIRCLSKKQTHSSSQRQENKKNKRKSRDSNDNSVEFPLERLNHHQYSTRSYNSAYNVDRKNTTSNQMGQIERCSDHSSASSISGSLKVSKTKNTYGHIIQLDMPD
jgi:hypothetical protein